MAFGFIPIIFVSALFGTYLAITPVSGSSTNAPQSNCERYSCVRIQINSDSSITGISVALFQEPSACLNPMNGVCDPGGNCNLPSNFCANVNTQATTFALTFQGAKQGNYWVVIYANVPGTNATREGLKTIYLPNQATYGVVVNITSNNVISGIIGSLATEVSMTNTTSK